MAREVSVASDEEIITDSGSQGNIPSTHVHIVASNSSALDSVVLDDRIRQPAHHSP